MSDLYENLLPIRVPPGGWVGGSLTPTNAPYKAKRRQRIMTVIKLAIFAAAVGAFFYMAHEHQVERENRYSLAVVSHTA